MKLECVHADTCLSSFWSVHHLPHIQIAAYKGMTLDAIKADILTELHCGAVSGRDFNSSDDEWYQAAIQSVHDIEPSDKEQKTFFNGLAETDDDDVCSECVYAFFIFREVE